MMRIRHWLASTAGVALVAALVSACGQPSPASMGSSERPTTPSAVSQWTPPTQQPAVSQGAPSTQLLPRSSSPDRQEAGRVSAIEPGPRGGCQFRLSPTVEQPWTAVSVHLRIEDCRDNPESIDYLFTRSGLVLIADVTYDSKLKSTNGANFFARECTFKFVVPQYGIWPTQSELKTRSGGDCDHYHETRVFKSLRSYSLTLDDASIKAHFGT